MDRLLDGYRRFRENDWPERRALFELLSEAGQRPRTLVIACSDSRVDPQMIFDAGPGELFVVRNVANLVPPYQPDAAYHGTSAALEFAVKALEVEDVVVMGHAQCGGLQALLNGVPDSVPDFVGTWIHIADRARERALKCESVEERQDVCEHEAIKVSIDNLMTFPWVRERVEAGRLRLQGCRFGIASGVLERLQPDGTFAAVA